MNMKGTIDLSPATSSAINELVELFDRIIDNPDFTEPGDEGVKEIPLSGFTTITLGYDKGEHRILMGNNYNKYLQVVRSLFRDVQKLKTLSHKRIEDIISDTLVEHWKSRFSIATELEAAKKAARKRVRDKINLPLSKWTVYYKVCGIRPPSQPIKLGKHRLLNFDDEFIDIELKQALDVPEKEEHDNLPYRKFIDTAVPDLISSVALEISIEAHDATAANDLAIQEVEFIIDIINFYSDYLLGICAYLPRLGNKADSKHEVLILNRSKPKLNSKQNWENPHKYGFGIDIEKLSNLGKDVGYNRIFEILARNSQTELEKSILAAIKMAGRATVADEVHQSFLFYTIALESLLGGSEKTEITFRLTQRVPLLIETNGTKRLEIRNKIGELYNLRSRLVHTGQVEISNEDFQVLRVLTLRCIFEVILNDELMKLIKQKEFLNWLDDKALL